MTGYEFHPEAETDVDEIWEYIAADNVRAADRVIAEIEQALSNLVSFPQQGHPPHRPHRPATALYPRPGLPDCLRAR